MTEGCSNVSGATAPTYELGLADVGHIVRVIVTASGAGGATPATSASVGPVSALPPTASFTYSPASPVAGQPVTFDGTRSTCPDGPCSYEWSDDGSITRPIPPLWPLGSGQTLQFTFSEAATKYVRLVVTDATGQTATVEHNVVVADASSPPGDISLPTVSGTAEEGKTLSASTGTWSGNPTSYSYQWKNCNALGESCTNVAGATASSYKLTAGDVGHTLRVVVTASNAGGSGEATSAASATVVADPPAAPINTVLPSVSGTAEPGQLLSASAGIWTNNPTSYAYQWQDCNARGENCTSIAGTTASSYTLAASDVGSTIRIVVTASNASGSTPASSTATATVSGQQTLNCFSTPGVCGYPDPVYGNVGPTDGISSIACSSLTPSGSVIVSTAGATVSNLNVTGTIAVNAANVTIDNVCVTNDGAGNVNNGPAVRFEAAGGLIEHSTVRGANETTESVEQAIASENKSATAEYDYFYNCGECVHDSGWTVANSYIDINGAPYSGGYSSGKGQGSLDHHESLYCNNCTAALTHDTLLDPWGEVASSVFADVNSGSGGICSNKLSVTNSFIAGGGFLIYQCPSGTSVGTASLTFTGNDVARCTTGTITQATDGGYDCGGVKTTTPGSGADSHGFWPYGGHYGVDSYTYCTAGTTQWSGNHWDDNGASIGC